MYRGQEYQFLTFTKSRSRRGQKNIHKNNLKERPKIICQKLLSKNTNFDKGRGGGWGLGLGVRVRMNGAFTMKDQLSRFLYLWVRG